MGPLPPTPLGLDGTPCSPACPRGVKSGQLLQTPGGPGAHATPAALKKGKRRPREPPMAARPGGETTRGREEQTTGRAGAAEAHTAPRDPQAWARPRRKHTFREGQRLGTSGPGQGEEEHLTPLLSLPQGRLAHPFTPGGRPLPCHRGRQWEGAGFPREATGMFYFPSPATDSRGVRPLRALLEAAREVIAKFTRSGSPPAAGRRGRGRADWAWSGTKGAGGCGPTREGPARPMPGTELGMGGLEEQP